MSEASTKFFLQSLRERCWPDLGVVTYVQLHAYTHIHLHILKLYGNYRWSAPARQLYLHACIHTYIAESLGIPAPSHLSPPQKTEPTDPGNKSTEPNPESTDPGPKSTVPGPKSTELHMPHVT